jgi:hypothetical protein
VWTRAPARKPVPAWRRHLVSALFLPELFSLLRVRQRRWLAAAQEQTQQPLARESLR